MTNLHDSNTDSMPVQGSDGAYSPQLASQGGALQSLNGTSGALPQAVWNSALWECRKFLWPATEAPEEYIFASSYILTSLVIGRGVYVQMGRRLYVNPLICLLGRAALKKGTPWAILDSEILQPHVLPGGYGIHVVRGTGSAEGLLEQFMEESLETDSKGKTQMKLLPVPERRVITVEEEMGYFLVKAHSDATANLREITCQLGRCGHCATHSKTKPEG